MLTVTTLLPSAKSIVALAARFMAGVPGGVCSELLSTQFISYQTIVSLLNNGQDNMGGDDDVLDTQQIPNAINANENKTGRGGGGGYDSATRNLLQTAVR